MNLDHVVQLRRNADFRGAYARAWAVTIDGAPIMLWARMRGQAPPERITGADMFVELACAIPPQRRLFFVVSTSRTGEGLLEHFTRSGHPAEALAYHCPPFGFEDDAEETRRLLEAISAHGPTDLFFGVGAPKSEIWLDRHRLTLGPLYAYGFGAGLDFLAGTAPRAPKAARQSGLEWLWRLVNDPVRLWRRYLVDSWSCLPALANDLIGRAPHGRRHLED